MDNENGRCSFHMAKARMGGKNRLKHLGKPHTGHFRPQKINGIPINDVARNLQTGTPGSAQTISPQLDEELEIKPLQTPIPTATDVGPPAGVEPVIVAQSNVYLRSGPGTEYEIVGILSSGNELEIIGRNAQSSWWHVSAPEGPAWVAGSVAQAYHLNESIPVIEAPLVEVEPMETPLSEPTFQCVGGCTTPPDPSCEIKGNVSRAGDTRIYHVPGGSYYERTNVSPKEGVRW